MSVADAIARGRWTVKAPMNVALIAVTFALVGAALLADHAHSVGRALLATLTGFLTGWILSAVLWCLLIPRWRLWAYERVDDTEALELAAIRANLIWPPGHPFGKAEFRPPTLAAKLRPFEDYIWSRVQQNSSST